MTMGKDSYGMYLAMADMALINSLKNIFLNGLMALKLYQNESEITDLVREFRDQRMESLKLFLDVFDEYVKLESGSLQIPESKFNEWLQLESKASKNFSVFNGIHDYFTEKKLEKWQEKILALKKVVDSIDDMPKNVIQAAIKSLDELHKEYERDTYSRLQIAERAGRP